ncbi:MAG: YraN family protein [Clostridia bacterium]|nr:YraN family protein [Clostridia bacterium]MBR6890716.1 YraN family protein [Clostridia bacterium]
MNKRQFGSEGEAEARAFLQRRGAKILEMNYRRPTGEIDIIARHKKVLLFVEVKRRSSLRFGRPSEAVDRAKQAHILRTAQLYLQEKRLQDAKVRFDIIEVLPGEIRHIENAFDAGAIL